MAPEIRCDKLHDDLAKEGSAWGGNNHGCGGEGCMRLHDCVRISVWREWEGGGMSCRWLHDLAKDQHGEGMGGGGGGGCRRLHDFAKDQRV